MPPPSPPPIESLADFGRYLRNHRNIKHLTLDQLAQKTAISKPYLSNIETARTPGPASDEKLTRLESALEMPAGALVKLAAWLRTPPSVRAMLQTAAPPDLPRRVDGSVDLDTLLGQAKAAGIPLHLGTATTTAPRVPGTRKPTLRIRMVPLINRVAAGPATEYTDLGYPVGIADDYVPAVHPSDDLPSTDTPPPGVADSREYRSAAPPPQPPPPPMFAARVAGDSMWPDYMEGEVVIVGLPPEPADTLTPQHDSVEMPPQPGLLSATATDFKDGTVCLVRLDAAADYAQTLKRVCSDPADPETLRLVPINPAYPTRTVHREQITGIYPVLWKLVKVR